MSTGSDGDDGFFTFYREYAHTGLHTITATALTAFGLLTFVHRGFVVLAIAVYILPPIYLYVTRDGEAPEPVDTDADSERSTTDGADPETGTGAGIDNGDAGPDTDEGRPSASATRDPTAGDAGVEPAGSEGATGEAEPETGTVAGGNVSDPESRTDPAGDSPTVERAEPETGAETEAASDSGKSEAGGERVGDGDDDPVPGGVGSDDGGEDGDEPIEWVETDSPTDETLHDAVSAGEGAYAAGEGGVLLARSPDGDWELALESGPAAESTTLRGVDATDDGEAIWVAGDSGVLGRYDPTTARHTDHSAPKGITDNWSGLAVAGTAGGERLALVNGSGQVLFGAYDGSEVEWEKPTKPGSGSSMSAITFVDESMGYCCDTNAGVYRIEGDEFERIGIENASGFAALAATPETVAVTSDDGALQRFDGSVWTPVRVAEGALSGLDTDGEEWLAVGAGGAIHESRKGDWEAVDSPTEVDLHGVAVSGVSVAVGAGGTVVERR